MAKLRVIPGGKSAADEFGALMQPHFDALYRSACWLTGSVQDAEDLVQDACLRVFPKLHELRALENPRSWLLCVLYRLFVDLARKRERSPLRLMSTLDATESAPFMASDEPGPDRQADGIMGEERLERAWRHLDEDQRALLSLHDIEGYSLAELQDITGLAQGTLKSRLHRARVRLGRLLKREACVHAPNTGDSSNELPKHRGAAR